MSTCERCIAGIHRCRPGSDCTCSVCGLNAGVTSPARKPAEKKPAARPAARRSPAKAVPAPVFPKAPIGPDWPDRATLRLNLIAAGTPALVADLLALLTQSGTRPELRERVRKILTP